MFDRSQPRYWILRFCAGLLLITLAGIGIVHRLHIPDRIGLLTFVLGLTGFKLALDSVTPLVRLISQPSRTRVQWSEAAQAAFARASLPRRVYYLLAAIAEADGPMTAKEREAVSHFVLERFGDPIHVDELRLWETQPLPVVDRIGLAARIGQGLDVAELDSLFCWCCLVAFADGSFGTNEHQALHDVARGLGIAAPRARMLFHLARAQFLQGDRRGERQRPADAPRPGDARSQALDVLGLPTNATPEQIRKRHRELVRKFHPDAQPNLGPVALEEATARFTAIQRAYELLAG